MIAETRWSRQGDQQSIHPVVRGMEMEMGMGMEMGMVREMVLVQVNRTCPGDRIIGTLKTSNRKITTSKTGLWIGSVFLSPTRPMAPSDVEPNLMMVKVMVSRGL